MNEDYKVIIEEALKDADPKESVKKALKDISFNCGKIVLVAVGKGGYEMAKSAYDVLGDRIDKGIVITKYNHIKGEIGNLELYEGGHPIPDQNCYVATERAISFVENLDKDDNVLFLLSGGGSALFEKPLISPNEMADITEQLLKCSASINEINTIRKRLSGVKGGKFAKICYPAKVFSIILSDVLGDLVDVIASGPTCVDSSTTIEGKEIAIKYNLKLSAKAKQLLDIETPKNIDNATNILIGSVNLLCKKATETCNKLGYESIFLSSNICCSAKDCGSFLSSIAKDYQMVTKSTAFICGGETVVKITGNGLGGRNQELALSSAIGLENCVDTTIFSIGSDGTDGPTDAAGGIVDENTAKKLRDMGVSIEKVLQDNDSYNALKLVDGLIFTGPTGTNVNDLMVLLIKR